MKAGARSTPFHSLEDLERPTSVRYTTARLEIAEINNDRQDLPKIVVDSVQEIAILIEATCLGASVRVTQDGVVAVNLFKEAPEQANASREGTTVPLPYDVYLFNQKLSISLLHKAQSSDSMSNNPTIFYLILDAQYGWNSYPNHCVDRTRDIGGSEERPSMPRWTYILRKPIERKRIVETIRSVYKNEN
ncbi:hypothetical protein U9M48_018500 [Paspalum notatum var. saurae]|uniref:Uncharacterized protein n=1 Tax=Paspalum notatum var. saurae TaxID=547442 RepID=A0AAQ3TAU5_PASNO